MNFLGNDMEIKNYFLTLEGCPPLWSGVAIVASSGSYCSPIAYIRKPKWIKDEDEWKKMIGSLVLTYIPQEIE